MTILSASLIVEPDGSVRCERLDSVDMTELVVVMRGRGEATKFSSSLLDPTISPTALAYDRVTLGAYVPEDKVCGPQDVVAQTEPI